MEHSTASDASIAAAAATAAASEASRAKQEADSKQQEALEAKLRATQKAEIASSEALNHQKDAKAKSDAAEEKAKELCMLARTAQLSDKFDADSRAFRETVMSTMLAAEVIAAEGLAVNPAQALQQATTARTGGHTRIGGVAAVTAAFNAATNDFPVMNPGTWFPSPICGGGGGPASKTRPASQPPAGHNITAVQTGRRRRRTEDADKGN